MKTTAYFFPVTEMKCKALVSKSESTIGSVTTPKLVGNQSLKQSHGREPQEGGWGHLEGFGVPCGRTSPAPELSSAWQGPSPHAGLCSASLPAQLPSTAYTTGYLVGFFNYIVQQLCSPTRHRAGSQWVSFHCLPKGRKLPSTSGSSKTQPLPLDTKPALHKPGSSLALLSMQILTVPSA